jgi:hypothetical protein
MRRSVREFLKQIDFFLSQKMIIKCFERFRQRFLAAASLRAQDENANPSRAHDRALFLDEIQIGSQDSGKPIAGCKAGPS